jgi:hypothetical protein
VTSDQARVAQREALRNTASREEEKRFQKTFIN